MMRYGLRPHSSLTQQHETRLSSFPQIVNTLVRLSRDRGLENSADEFSIKKRSLGQTPLGTSPRLHDPARVKPNSMLISPFGEVRWSAHLLQSMTEHKMKRSQIASELKPITRRGSTQLMERIGDSELQISVYTGTSPPHTHRPTSPQPRLKRRTSPRLDTPTKGKAESSEYS